MILTRFLQILDITHSQLRHPSIAIKIISKTTLTLNLFTDLLLSV